MSVAPQTDTSERYCDPSDVATYFDKIDEFTADTNPTESEVISLIMAKCDWIDSHTNHAWRERRIENEFHNLEGPYRWRSGMPIKLQRRDIRPLDPEKGDKLEFYRTDETGDGSNYEDWLTAADRESGRNGDYWVERSTGMLHIQRRAVFWRRYREFRITYRYGKNEVPQAIREAAAKLTAADLLEAQQYTITTPGNDEAPQPENIAESWREQVREQLLQPYVEVRSVGL